MVIRSQQRGIAVLQEIPGQSALVQLVYASASTVPFTSDQLDQLLEGARKNNALLGVSGVLLFHAGTFFQVLEGVPDVVRGLYDKIALDTRHNNILLLAKRDIEERNFGDWNMGFVRDQRQISELPGFVDFFSGRTFVDLEGDSQRVRQILDGFRRGRWRRSPVDSQTVS